MYLPTASAPIRIMSLDPGSSKLGVSIIEMCPSTNYVNIVFATTIEPGKWVDKDHVVVDTFGMRTAKIKWIEQQLYYLLCQFHPSMLIAEAPYMGRFATSFEALVEVRDAIKGAIMSYNPGLYFETIEPLNVKMAVGINLNRENRKDKNAVRKALAELPNVIWAPGLSIETSDEHTVDAIAVGYWKAMQMISIFRFY